MSISSRTDRSGYTIAAVSKLTGVSCHTLRIWERRYGFPEPRRSPAGHRRYGADQVEQIGRLSRLIQAGHSVGEVIDSLRHGTLPPEPTGAEVAGLSPCGRLVERLEAGDLAGAQVEYGRAVAGLDVGRCLEQVIEPALVEIGERGFRHDCEVFQGQCACGFLRRKLAELYDLAQAANSDPSRTALVGAVQGDRHEGGVLIVATLLELAGWRAVAIGVDLPVREFQKAIDHWRPAAVAVSFVLSRNITKRFAELSSLHGAPIFVGGRSILNYRRLARRYGLIAVPGSGPSAVNHLIAALEAGPPESRCFEPA